jgi:phosphatidylserine decarboxylase
MQDKLKSILPVHKEGYPFIVGIAFLALFLWIFSNFWFVLGLFSAGFCAYLFRDPARVIPTGDSIILSPADGVIDDISEVQSPEELGIKGTWNRIGIKLSLLDVHINRAPVSGKIEKILLSPASSDKPLESNLVVFGTANEKIIVKQIAGRVTRTTVTWVNAGDQIAAGDKFGMIRVGCRVEIFIPQNLDIQVQEGQTVVGGETIFGSLKSNKEVKALPKPTTSKPVAPKVEKPATTKTAKTAPAPTPKASKPAKATKTAVAKKTSKAKSPAATKAKASKPTTAKPTAAKTSKKPGK